VANVAPTFIAFYYKNSPNLYVDISEGLSFKLKAEKSIKRSLETVSIFQNY